MLPAYVKPYAKRNKTDVTDAAACCEAVGRPDMRFLAVKTVEQEAALSLQHRVGSPRAALSLSSDQHCHGLAC